MTQIFEYYNYRFFLRDYFESKRNTGERISHRKVLQEMGVTSTGFLANVINGRKNLNASHIFKLSRVMRLAKQEARYFEALVYFGQSRNADEKSKYFLRMAGLREPTLKSQEEAKFRVYSKWFNLAIRELLGFYRFKGDYETLAKALMPTIKPYQAESAIADLTTLKLIQKDANNNYRKKDTSVTENPEVQSILDSNFQEAMLDLAKQTSRHFEKEEYVSAANTYSFSVKAYEKVKNEILQLQKNLAKLAKEDQKSDRVYQINVQLFPLSKKQ